MNRRTARSTLIASFACAATLLPALGASAHEADEDHGNACTVAGSVVSLSGLRYEPGQGTYNVSGTMDCTSDRYSHGILTGQGTGVLGCVGGFSDAVYRVAWSNGETSTIKVKSGDLTYGTGGIGKV